MDRIFIILHNNTKSIEIELSKEKLLTLKFPLSQIQKSFFSFRGVTNGCFIYSGNEFAAVKKLIQPPETLSYKMIPRKFFFFGGG